MLTCLRAAARPWLNSCTASGKRSWQKACFASLGALPSISAAQLLPALHVAALLKYVVHYCDCRDDKCTMRPEGSFTPARSKKQAVAQNGRSASLAALPSISAAQLLPALHHQSLILARLCSSHASSRQKAAAGSCSNSEQWGACFAIFSALHSISAAQLLLDLLAQGLVQRNMQVTNVTD